MNQHQLYVPTQVSKIAVLIGTQIFKVSLEIQGGSKVAADNLAAKRKKHIFSCNASLKNHLLQKRYLAAILR